MVTGRKLLLADDSVTIQKVVDLTFSDEGLEVVTVGDGHAALEKLEEFTPDIVLADVFMPGLNGYQICEHIKRTESLSHIPVMLLVGSFEPFDEAEARRVGADDYLTKPFQSIRTLIGKVRNLMSGGGSAPAEGDEHPTRQLAPPPAAEKENRSGADFLERSTADTAPLPINVNDETEQAGIAAREVPFTDLSMDDEMIEATPAGDYENAGHNVQAKATAQYTAADLRAAGVMDAAREKSPEPEVAYAPTAPADETINAAPSQPQSTPRSSARAATDDSLLDLGDIEPPPAAMTEADDFLLDLLDEAPSSAAQAKSQAAAEPAAQPLADTFRPSIEAASTSMAGGNSTGGEGASVAPPAQAYSDRQAAVEEETNWQDAPAEDEAIPSAVETAESWQEASTADFQAAPTARLPEGFQIEGSAAGAAPAAAAQTPQESAAPQAHSGQITLDQLAPEVIDAIARRAAEHLSEKVVEQIAWEVVPQLAELLIKRRLEEEKQ